MSAHLLTGGATNLNTQSTLGRATMARATAAAPTILGVIGVWRFWQSADQRGQFVSAARINFVFLGRCLLFAFMLESLMVAYVPDTLVAS